MNEQNLYLKKYKKYKEKYLNLKQTIINQRGGNLCGLREYLKEASEIFKIVDEYGRDDGISFFITGSVAVLFYFVDYYTKNAHLLTEGEIKSFNNASKYIVPNDLDIFWAEFYPSVYELFMSEIENYINKKINP